MKQKAEIVKFYVRLLRHTRINCSIHFICFFLFALAKWKMWNTHPQNHITWHVPPDRTQHWSHSSDLLDSCIMSYVCATVVPRFQFICSSCSFYATHSILYFAFRYVKIYIIYTIRDMKCFFCILIFLFNIQNSIAMWLICYSEKRFRICSCAHNFIKF